MMFFLLTSFTFGSLVGIDIGSELIRAAILKPGKQIEVLVNPENGRIFPAYMTMVPKKNDVPDTINEMDVADFDFTLNDPLAAKKYPNTTIHHWSNFLAKVNGQQISDLALRRKFYAKLTKHFNDRVLVAGVFPEIIFHRILDQINQSVRILDKKDKVTSTVITIPKYYPQQERDALHTVAKKKGFKPFIVDESRSVSTYFALEHQKLFTRRPMTVAFFDYGSSNVQITISQFTKKRNVAVKELSYQWDDQNGGRDMDIAIYNLLTANYPHKITPRGEQNILLEANKIKHRLTVDQQVIGMIDSPDGKNDLTYKITREEFEAAIKPQLDSIRELIKKSLDKDGKQIEIDRVQIIGGLSRVPAVQTVLKEAFGVDRLMSNLNIEESNAIGGTYVGATNSYDYKLPKIDYTPLEIYTYYLRAKTNMRMPFIPNSIVPHPGEHHWVFCEGESFPIGSSKFITWGNTNGTTTINLTKDGLFRFRNRPKGSLPWKDQVFTIAEAIEKQEADKKLLEETVNKLETLLLETNEIIYEETKLNGVSTENERKAISLAVESTQKWFNAQRIFEQKPTADKLGFLESAVGSVLCRIQNQEYLEEATKNMTKKLQQLEIDMKRDWSVRKKKPKREKIRLVFRMIAELKLWYKEKLEKQSKLKPTENPILKWNDINRRVDEIVEKYEDIKEITIHGKPKKSSEEQNVYVSKSMQGNVKIE